MDALGKLEGTLFSYSPTFPRDLPPSRVHPELDGARQTMNHFVNRINFDLNLDQF